MNRTEVWHYGPDAEATITETIKWRVTMKPCEYSDRPMQMDIDLMYYTCSSLSAFVDHL